MAATMRRVIAADSIRSFECTLPHHDVDAPEQLLRAVERAVLEDVALDSGQDAERLHLLVQLRHTSSCSRRRSGGRPWAIV